MERMSNFLQILALSTSIAQSCIYSEQGSGIAPWDGIL